MSLTKLHKRLELMHMFVDRSRSHALNFQFREGRGQCYPMQFLTEPKHEMANSKPETLSMKPLRPKSHTSRMVASQRLQEVEAGLKCMKALGGRFSLFRANLLRL